MATWHSLQGLFGRIVGGWRTHGPHSGAFVDAAFDSREDFDLYGAATKAAAMKLSAVWACMTLRAETLGTLPLHLRDKDKKLVTDHPLYDVIHNSPNALMTAPEYWSLANAHVDMYGNHISVVQRRTRDKSVISLEPMFDPSGWTIQEEKSGRVFYQSPDGQKYDPENILHLKDFTLDNLFGLSRFQIGKHILAAQIEANTMALKAFKQGLKIGGFFQVDGPKDLDTDQLKEWNEKLSIYGRPENTGKWMTLLKGMVPIGGAKFRPKASDAELLASRFFGVEEVCRLFNTPPQLIGHSDKASSWASSLENVNLFFLMYALQPRMIRTERRITKTLISPADRVRGIEPKFSIAGLLRADAKTRALLYQAELRSGMSSINELRDLEDRPGIGPEGDVYRVQAQMVDVDKLSEQNAAEDQGATK